MGTKFNQRWPKFGPQGRWPKPAAAAGTTTLKPPTPPPPPPLPQPKSPSSRLVDGHPPFIRRAPAVVRNRRVHRKPPHNKSKKSCIRQRRNLGQRMAKNLPPTNPPRPLVTPQSQRSSLKQFKTWKTQPLQMQQSGKRYLGCR